MRWLNLCRGLSAKGMVKSTMNSALRRPPLPTLKFVRSSKWGTPVQIQCIMHAHSNTSRGWCGVIAPRPCRVLWQCSSAGNRPLLAASERLAEAQTALPPSPTGQRMILTDAMALLYRSHFAFGPDHRLRTAAGEDTTVVFGFLSTLLSLLELNPAPTHLAVVFDARGKNFRHELYAGYKGQRPEAPPEVRAAVPLLREVLRAMAVPELSVPGVEADDVIGTLAVRGVEEGMAVAIASPDKDFFQLLRPGLILLRPPKKPDAAAAAAAAGRQKFNKFALVPYTEEHFRQDWSGLSPGQFVDVLALAGDASDNVPGVAGVGPKTAQAMLQRYGSLEGVLAHAAEAKPKKAAAELASEKGAAAARLSRQLVEIRTHLDLPPAQVPLDMFRLRCPADGGQEALRLLADLQINVHAVRLKALWAAEADAAARRRRAMVDD